MLSYLYSAQSVVPHIVYILSLSFSPNLPVSWPHKDFTFSALLSFFVTPKPAPGSSGDDEKQVELPSTSGRGRKKRTLAPSDTSPSLAKKPKNLKTEEAGSAHGWPHSS